jgi:hypothetical protein
MADGSEGTEYQRKLAHLLADLSNNFHDFTVKIETNWRIDGEFGAVGLKYTKEEKDKNPTIVKFQSKHRDRNDKTNTINIHRFFYDKQFAFQKFFSTFIEKFEYADKEEVANFVLVTNIPMEVSMGFEKYLDENFILNRLNGTESYQIERTDGNIKFLKRYLLTMEFVKCVFRKTRSENPSHFERIFSDVFESEKNILLQKVHVENGAQKWEVIDKEMFKSCATYLRNRGTKLFQIPKQNFWDEVDEKLNGYKNNRTVRGKFWDNLAAIPRAQNEATTSEKLKELIGNFLDKFIISTKLTPDSIDDYFQKTRRISEHRYVLLFHYLKKYFKKKGYICSKESYNNDCLTCRWGEIIFSGKPM